MLKDGRRVAFAPTELAVLGRLANVPEGRPAKRADRVLVAYGNELIPLAT